MFVPKSFFVLVVLCLSSPAFAFGGAGADCDGDGKNDISCSGIHCHSRDEGIEPGSRGYCECTTANGPNDHKTCADLPTIAPMSWHGEDLLWLSPQLAVDEENREEDAEGRHEAPTPLIEPQKV
ncbi:MAG: hypothetical protein AAGM22_25575 [Acidobacteriota bacterium]